MSKPSVLIVGAGAVGLAVGYHLSLAGADITPSWSALDEKLYALPRNNSTAMMTPN
jgi:ketopantoate reductase